MVIESDGRGHRDNFSTCCSGKKSCTYGFQSGWLRLAIAKTVCTFRSTGLFSQHLGGGGGGGEGGGVLHPSPPKRVASRTRLRMYANLPTTSSGWAWARTATYVANAHVHEQIEDTSLCDVG